MAIEGVSANTSAIPPDATSRYQSQNAPAEENQPVEETASYDEGVEVIMTTETAATSTSEATPQTDVERLRESQSDDMEQPQAVSEAEREQSGEPVARSDATDSVTTGQAQVNAVDSSAQKANVAIAVGTTVDISV